MPKREDETYRNIYPHPAYCTCWECTQKRLRVSRDASLTSICPVCRKKSLFYNRNSRRYECLNLKCKASGRTLGEIRSYERYMTPAETARAAERYTERQREHSFAPASMEYSSRSRKSGVLPGWLMTVSIVLLMMFGAVVWGLLGGSTSTSPPAGVSEQKGMPTAEEGISIFDGKQPPFSKTLGGEPIHLINNKDAADPTWQQLITFLLADKTDQEDYSVISFPCGAFAEEVHNNAEAAGVRAAWVAVDFTDNPEVHALNAFETIDKGLVFIDCTGQGFSGLIPVVPYSPDGSTTYGDVENWDKIAYVVVTKDYGLISLDVAASPQYSFYETYLAKLGEYDNKLEAYNQEAEAYNQALGGRLYLAEPEYSRFLDWHNSLEKERLELEAMLKGLGNFQWGSLGIVSEIEIYW